MSLHVRRTCACVCSERDLNGKHTHTVTIHMLAKHFLSWHQNGGEADRNRERAREKKMKTENVICLCQLGDYFV